MISIDGSVLIQIANFLFLIWALNTVLYKPIRSILLRRKEKISGLEQNIASFSQQAEEKDESFASGIKSARAKGLKEKESLLQKAAEEEKKMIQAINQKALEDLSEVRQRIGREIDHVRMALEKEIDGFVNQIGNKILGRTVS